MSVRIRLARIGKKKAPFYRIVAVDKRSKRDGQYLENLGTYNPLTGEIIQFHAEKLADWISKGAIPSDTVLRIKKQHARGETGPKVKAAPAPTKKAAPAEKKVEVKAEEPAPKKEDAAPKIEAKKASVQAKSEEKVEVPKTDEASDKPA